MLGGNIPPQHYYGDLVRRFFLAAGCIMLIMLPFVQNRLPISFVLAILLILIIDVFAGITNPKWEWAVIADSVISLMGFLWYAYYSVVIYMQHTVYDVLFWINGVLAIVFFFALYFATKTLRGTFFS